MEDKNESLWLDIVKFLEDGGFNSFFWKKIPITRAARLEQDLGITGDDADEFMYDFVKKFPFDIGDFRLDDYFEGEGFCPFPTRRKNKIKPITVGMLEEAVKAGVWNSAELDTLITKARSFGI